MNDFPEKILNLLEAARAKQPERVARILARATWKDVGEALLQVQLVAERDLGFDEVKNDTADSGPRLRALNPEHLSRMIGDRELQVNSVLNPNNSRVEEALVKSVSGAHEHLSALA